MTIEITPEQEMYLKQQMAKRGFANPSQYVMALLQRDMQQEELRGDANVDTWLNRITGVLKTDKTTEEMMNLTRSEV